MEYANGDDETNNRHLAEAIDITREGSAQPGSASYDQGESPTLRDSTFHSAIEKLNEISTAPEESQAEIDEIIELLQRGMNGHNDRRARVMAEAHDRLQDVWAPPE